jgi:glycosyltransferase involved in cell wall biosynthesis
MARPELSVVVASHDRPLRLRWLLNALAEQTLDRDLWEVVVCHDSGESTDAVLRDHALAAAGVLRHTRLPAGSAPPGTNRNAALALARAPTVVFTDDDCRPPPEWLARVREAVAAHPGAIVQGPVLADPDEAAMLRSPYPSTQHFTDVPTPWAECANIAYPRAVLDTVGGFAEDVRTGEDTDLVLRALWAGAAYLGDGAMATRHAIEEGTLLGRLRGTVRWGDLALLVARHPEVRSHLYLRYFWKDTHALLLLALAGFAVPGRRRRLGLALAVPWALARPSRGGGTRGRARHLAELPGWALIDLAEIAVLARASVRAGALLL